MASTKKHFVTWIVLFCFYFQALWPCVVFASDGGLEVLKAPASSLSNFSTASLPPACPVIAIAPFTLQTFVDDQLEGFDGIASKPVVSFPGAASLAEAQQWFDDSLEAQSLYPGLVVTEQGLLWSQNNLNFLMGLTGHLFVAPLPHALTSAKALRLHNYHGDVVFGGGLSLSHIQVQARNILQASSNSVIERLEIWAMGYDSREGRVEGRFTNREGGSLTTTQVTVHEGNLENQGTWKVSDRGVIDLQGHDFINEETLSLENEAVVKNQGTFGNTGIVNGSSYTLEMMQGENASVITGDAPYVKVSGTLINQEKATILGKSSLTISGNGTVTNYGSVTSERALMLENKAFDNHGLVHSEGTMLLALQGKMVNKGTGSMVALGQTTIEGVATIQNDAPLSEHAGMAFAGGLYFKNFQGEVINEGIMTSQATITGVLRKLVNSGTFGTNESYQKFRILDFLNERSGIFLGEGFLTLTGINRGLMQSDRLSLEIEGTFTHGKGALLKGETAIETRGNGTFIRHGVIETPQFIINTAGFENGSDLVDEKMVVVVGVNATRWKNNKDKHFKTKELTFEAGSGTSRSDAFVNEGTLEIDTFINRRSDFTNRGQMTLRQWRQLGLSFKNELGATVDVSGSTEVEMDTVDNEGDINWDGTLQGRIGQILNKGGMILKGDTHLKGTRLDNTKNFRALGIFDWVGETLDNRGKMALFNNRVRTTQQVINRGLFLWTHNSFWTFHFLNMGWAERTKDFDVAIPNTWQAPKDDSTNFKNGTIENRGVLKLKPQNYVPCMDFRVKGKKFEHWFNDGEMYLPTTHLKAQTLNNKGDLIVEGDLTGHVETFENSKSVLTTGKVDLSGKTFANSGTLKGDRSVAYNGETVTATDVSVLSGKEIVVLTATTPLTIRGKLQGKQGITLTAPQIDNRGELTVETGKATIVGDFKNYHKFNVDEWVYEGAEFTNEGTLEANTYNRNTAFINLVNESKSLVIRKGTFTAKKMKNRGKLQLSGGLYRFENWDNIGGNADIDQLCLSFLNPLLEGKLDANVLVSFGKTYDALAVFGETVFRKGGFTTRRLTTRSSLTLGDGAYSVDHLDNEEKVEIRLLPKTQLELKGQIDNRGEIVSDTGLEIMSRQETPLSFMKKTVTTPKILLDSFWGKGKTSSYDIRRLGGMNIIESISLLFGTENHIAYFLDENVSKWAVGQKVLLTGDCFENASRALTLPWPVEMLIRDFYQKQGVLKTKGLTVASTTFRLGEDNDNMGKMEIYGPLKIDVKEAVDNRFGVIRATGKTEVVSHNDNILIGAPASIVEEVEDEDSCLNGIAKSKSKHQVSLLKQNGAKIITNDKLDITAHDGNIITSFGAVHGDVETSLSTTADHKITNKSGSITSYGRISLISEELENLIGDVITFEGHAVPMYMKTGGCVYHGCDVGRRRQHPVSGPGIIASTGGDILINVRKGKNIGSKILTPKNLRYWDGWSYNDSRPSSFEVKELPIYATLYIAQSYGPHGGLGISHETLPSIPSPVRGGESLDIETGLFHITGTLSAPKVKVRGNRLNAHTTSDRSAIVLQGDVEIDLLTFYKKLKKTLPVIADFIQRQNQQSIQDSAVVLDQKGDILVPFRSLSFSDGIPPLALTDEALRFTVMFVLSDMLGTLNIGGRSGEQLLLSLYKKTKTIEKQLQKEGQLITRNRLQSFHEGMIYYVIEQIGNELLRVPKMLVTPEMVNPYGQTSAAITGTDLDLEFTDGVDGRPTLHAAVPIPDKKITDRLVEDNEEEDKPALQPSLKLIVDNAPICLTDALVKSDGKAHLETKKSGDINLLATEIEGENDVTVKSAANTNFASTFHRTAQGENFIDRVNQASVKSKKGHLTIDSKLNTVFKALHTYSKKGTTFKGNGHKVDETLALATKTVTRDGKNWISDTYSAKQPSLHVSDADISSIYGGRQDLIATQFVVPKEKEVLIVGFEGVTAHEDHNTHEHASRNEKGKSGWFGRGSKSDFQSSSATSVGIKVTGGKATIISGTGDIILVNANFAVDQTTLTVLDEACKVLIKEGTNYYSSAFSEKGADIFWQTMTARTVQNQTYSDSQFAGSLDIYAREAIIQQVCGRTLSFMDRVDMKDGTLTIDYVSDLYDTKEQKVSGPTAALSAVIALAATMAAVASGGAALAGTSAVSALGVTGTTAAVVSGMGYAGFSALCAQTAMALANNNMDPGRAAHDLVKKDSLKAMLIAMGTAGVVAGIGHAFSLPVSAADAKGLVDHVQRQALQQGVQASFSMADGEQADNVLKRAAVSVAAQSCGGVAANKIGAAYANHMFDSVTHKLLHMGMAAGIGGTSSAILGDDARKAALASAIGAGVAETMHEIIKEDSNAVADRVKQKAAETGVDLRDEASRKPLILDEIRTRLELSKFSGALAAFLSKQDVGVASTAATTAIDNNCASVVLGAVEFLILNPAVAGLGLTTLASAGLLAKQQIEDALNGREVAPDDARWADQGLTTEDGKPDTLEKREHVKRKSSTNATPQSTTNGSALPPDWDPEDKNEAREGVRVDSKEIWRDKDNPRVRIDVENPNPGSRPGQIHYQDGGGNKYIYDIKQGIFKGAPNRINEMLKENTDMKKAVEKALEKYLGVKK